MIGISLKRPVTVFMVVMGLAVFGVISYRGLGRDLLPEIAYPSLTVMTKYEGAAPQEVEEFITKKLESALATVKGKRKLSSVSREGMSLITIEFQWGEDMQIATLNVREKLDVARFQTGFPQDAERPNILRWDPSSKPIVGLAITADAPILDLKEGVEEIIKPRMEQLDGVALAQISGDVERVIDVEVDREKLALFGVDLQMIATAVGQANGNIAGGTIKKGRYRYALRTLGEFDSVDEINKVVVTRKNGIAVRVGDLADVKDTIKDREAQATVNGLEAIGLLVYKDAGSNTIRTTARIKELLKSLQKSDPNFKITLAFEEAKFIEQALNNVWISLFFGGIFAFLVLILFLRDLKSPVFIFMSIPIAIIATLVLMYFTDVTLNIMSLGGLALGVGMLVDNSIVVLENIYRYREMGRKPMQAAFDGAKEVAAPVFASTLTTIAVFFPIVYLKGITGALFGEQALTVTYSMLCSLVVSLTVLPLLTALSVVVSGRDKLPARIVPLPQMDQAAYPRGFLFWRWWEYLLMETVSVFVAAHFKLEWSKTAWIALAVGILPMTLFFGKWIMTFVLAWLVQALALFLGLIVKSIQTFLDKLVLPIFDILYNGFEHAYHRTLAWCLNRKLVTLSMALILLSIGLLGAGKLKKEMMPKSATGQFTIDVKLPPGTALEVTASAVESIERFLGEDNAVDVVFSQIGASEANLSQLLKDSGTNTAQVSVKMKPAFISLSEVRRLAEITRGYASKFDGMELTFTESESSFEDLLTTEGGAGLVVQVDGERFDELYQANDQILKALSSVEGIKDLKTSLTRDYPQMQIQLKRDNIERYGFSIANVGQYLAGGMRGAFATEYKEFDKRIDVRVRFARDDRENFDRILSTTVNSPDGAAVPITELMGVDMIKGAKEIRRIDQKRVALISASLADMKISEVVPAVQARLDELTLPAGVSLPRITGEQKGIQSSFGQLMWAFLLSSLLVYMIMAGQFESLLSPFVVIFTVPMGIVGTVFVLHTFSHSINIMSLIGLIVLSGIVVNDAIVKVDFIAQARRGGASIREAVLEASRIRLRPILMTTATTVLGLLPMASGLLPYIVNHRWLSPIVATIDGWMIGWGFNAISSIFSGQGAEIQRPLALVVIGGLSIATLLTLILIPVLYELFARELPGDKEERTVDAPLVDNP